MSPATSDAIERLARNCREAAPLLDEAVTAFDKLKCAIEAEGYQVIWHMHTAAYSLRKLEK